MKYLFLIDGAAGDAKKSIVAAINKTNRTVLAHSMIIKKESSRGARNNASDDIYGFDERNYSSKTIKDRYKAYSEEDNEIRSKYYCYQYPEAIPIEDCVQEYYSINKSDIDNFIRSASTYYGFLIVRNQNIIKNIIEDYNGRINVVPVYVHTDLYYIAKSYYDSEYARNVALAKAQKVFSDYEQERSISREFAYEEILIFSATNFLANQADFFESACASMERQIIHMLRERPATVNDKINVFVAMPFREKHNEKNIIADNNHFYQGIINSLNRLGLTSLNVYKSHAQEQLDTTTMQATILKKEIEEAHIVIVDLREHLINCYYELAYARAKGKLVITMVPKDDGIDRIPFDEAPFSHQCYNLCEYNDPTKFCSSLMPLVEKAIRIISGEEKL